MFTGIVEAMGSLVKTEAKGTNVEFWFTCPFTQELKVDQSLAHNGVCLTVVEIQGEQYRVTAIDETLQKTNLGDLKIDQKVNLERCMAANARFDGHIVQGHVDLTGICTEITDQNGSWEYRFSYPKSSGHVTVEKGSICVNGTSLTVVDSQDVSFTVCIIPYTYEHTVFHQLSVGDRVNLEFDILGKYIKKLMQR
ncbi:riboflavin synthase [Aquirufa antheringensis]|jgi:riboflavin synthase|uniref:Riboflavin synthase n=1 Tax=Aquirufa antheringensis TaxID=2516559 RepID=A0A4Q9B9Y8_9BACT|nr:riboflavin synthase [Aquirufa antheringensis]MCZ2486813.1 riboflavin synthase [Aquirufa antheringensis]MCZ2488405.1 riboflavin synthase [Aquirufa antheringensis]TBH72036.1 riboflavin synthase [Aquirufa antheringensis]